jgi:hypothetical protein
MFPGKKHDDPFIDDRVEAIVFAIFFILRLLFSAPGPCIELWQIRHGAERPLCRQIQGQHVLFSAAGP